MNTFNLSVFTSTKSAFINGREKLLLGKEFALDSDNNIVKFSNAHLIAGNVENVEVHGLQHLHQIIEALKPNQALSIGQNITSHNRIVTNDYVSKYAPCDAIARTKENFSFLSTHSLMFLDYDGDDYTLDEFRAKLIQLLPELEQCEMLMLGSSSCGIYKMGDPVADAKNGGIHTYFIVDNGTKIPDIGERLKYAAWIKGHGYHKVTSDGKLLPRQLLDDAVYFKLQANDDYYSDSITKLDWDDARDFERPWVKFFKPHIQNYLDKLSFALGYQSAIIDEIWFQQYKNLDSHGWHTHGSNFTGVYYLEFDEQSPKTEIIEPSNQSRKIVPDIKEGSVLIFPSYTIHRAPQIHNDIRKTIISFNYVVDLINKDTLNKIKSN